MTFSDFFDSFGDLDWLAIIVAAIAVFVLGWLWYGPIFGRAHAAEHGREMNEGTPELMTMMLGFAQFFVFSIAIAYFVPALHVFFQNTSSFETLVVSAFVFSFFIIGAVLAGRVIWLGGTWNGWLIDFVFWFLAAALSAWIQDLMA